MADKPIIYFNSAELTTTASGDYCLKLLRSKDTDDEDELAGSPCYFFGPRNRFPS